MKSIEELKSDLLNKDTKQGLYIFVGEENYIRREYIKKIREVASDHEYFYLDDVKTLFHKLRNRGLNRKNHIYHVFCDEDFINQKKEIYISLVNLVDGDIVILSYQEEKGKIFNCLNEYVTVFNHVSEDVATSFVMSRLGCEENMARMIAHDNKYDYGSILLEIDKIKRYKSDFKASYNALMENKQLRIDDDELMPHELSIALISKDVESLRFCHYMFKEYNLNILYYLNNLADSILIAIFIKKYGKYDGGKKAFSVGLNWGLVKKIRECSIIYNEHQLINMLGVVTYLEVNIKSGVVEKENGIDYLLINTL